MCKAAESQPQAAYVALSKSLQFEWTYLQRVLPDCANHFSPLRDIINESFWTSLFGCSVSEEESELFFLPTYMAGLGFRDPVVMASNTYLSSKAGMASVKAALKGKEQFSLADHIKEINDASAAIRSERRSQDARRRESVLQLFDNVRRRAIERAIEGKNSSWLNMLPVARYHYDLSPVEF